MRTATWLACAASTVASAQGHGGGLFAPQSGSAPASSPPQKSDTSPSTAPRIDAGAASRGGSNGGGGGVSGAQGNASGSDSDAALPPPRERASVLEFTLFIPAQFVQTQNKQGPATAYSALGYGLDAALCLAGSFCLLANGSSNLDADNGAALLSGVSAGLQGFFLGRADPPPEERGVHAGERRQARFQSIWRVAAQGGLCRKDFDFRSLYGEDTGGGTVFIGARPELEGSFWCLDGGLVVDYLFRSGHRVGLGATYFRSLKASQADLTVSGPSLQLRYQILRF